MTTLDDAVALAATESGLAVVSTVRADGSVQASLVNVGLLPHPDTGQPSLGFTTYGKVKIANLRARPQLAVTFKNSWQWATVEGRAELAGPDDTQPWLKDSDQLRLLLRDVGHERLFEFEERWTGGDHEVRAPADRHDSGRLNMQGKLLSR